MDHHFILDSEKHHMISLSLSNDFLTISLNDLGQEDDLDEFIKIAESINSVLKI